MKLKVLTFGTAQRMEMPSIKGEHVEDSMAFGKNDYRGIGETNGELAVASDHHGCRYDIARRERFELVCASSNFVKERPLRLDAHPGGKQVIEFRQDEGRKK